MREALTRASAASRFDAVQELFAEQALAAASELAARSDRGTLPLDDSGTQRTCCPEVAPSLLAADIWSNLQYAPYAAPWNMLG